MATRSGSLFELCLRARATAILLFVCSAVLAVFVWQQRYSERDQEVIFYRSAFRVWSGHESGFFLSTLSHYDWIHLLLNGLTLLLFGSLIEPQIGGGLLIATFAASAIAGNAIGILLSPAILSIGASGGVMGFVGAFAVIGLRSGRSPWEFFGQPMGRALIFLTAIQIVLGFVPESRFDNSAHIGGLAVGFALVLLFGPGRPRGLKGALARLALAVLLIESTVYALHPVLDGRYYATRLLAAAERENFTDAPVELEKLVRFAPEPERRRELVLSLGDPRLEEGPIALQLQTPLNYARVLVKAGRAEEAKSIVDDIVEAAHAALRQDTLSVNDRAELLNTLAYTLALFRRDLEEAWIQAKEAVHLAERPDFIGTLGVVALRLGRLDYARQCLARSSTEYVNALWKANDLYFLSIALSKLGRKDEAERCYRQAYALNPDADVADEAATALGPRGA